MPLFRCGGQVFRCGGSLLVASLSLVVGCSKGEPTPGTSPIPPVNAGLGAEQREAAARLTLNGAPAPAGEMTAAEVLKRSLNATVANTARFESAPFYTLTLDVDWDLFTYSGTQGVQYTNNETEALTELNFLVYPNSEELSGAGTRHLIVKNVAVDGQPVVIEQKGDRLRVPLTTGLAPKSAITVTMDFKGVIYRLPDGAGDIQTQAIDQVVQMVKGGTAKGGYGVFGFGDKILSLGLWHPILAAYDERGWDIEHGGGVGDVSYFDVSNFDVTVTAPADVSVVTTGIEVGKTVEGDLQTSRFVAGAVREFTVEASKEFQSKSAVVGDVKITSWYLDGDSRAGDQVLSHATEALKLYSRDFGPYPYTELDVVEAPLMGGAGGVEFPGLVTIGKMFYAPDHAPEGDPMAAFAESKYIQDTLEFIVAHEVAHEWWNATVGSDSKRHPFVDEALANHSALYYFEKVHGKKAASEQVELQILLPYHLARMVGSEDRPVDLPTAEFNGMMEYAAIVYGKGALFFDAMRARLGDQAYFEFLRGYYKRFAFEVATTDDLVGGMVRASSDPAGTQKLADRWLKESHGDRDIASVEIGSVLRSIVGDEALDGPLGQILAVAESKGARELVKVAAGLLSGTGGIPADVDWGAIVQMGMQLLGDSGGSLLGDLASGIAKNPGILKNGGDMRGLMKEVAKSIAGDDPEVAAVIEAADVMLKMFDAVGGDDSEPLPFGDDEEDEEEDDG